MSTNQGVTMIRNLKVLGVAFAAVLALSAVAATAASAEGKVTCTSYPCTLTGTSPLENDVFNTEGGKVECKAAFHSLISEASSSLTVTPTYTECRAFGFVNATVNMNGCDYLFTTPTKIGSHEWTSGSPSPTTNPSEVTHVLCPVGKAIEISSGTCKLAIHPQTLAGHLIITNTTNTPEKLNDIDIQATYENIKYTVVTDGFGCPFSGTGEKSGATYKQTKEVTIDAENATTHAAVEVDVG
jgi:hypothetical protein